MTEKVGAKPLRTLLFQNRRTLRELEREGISRRELKMAIEAVNADGELPRGENTDTFTQACIIAAELADNPAVSTPKGINWDKIIELIERLMPLIEAWLSSCML